MPPRLTKVAVCYPERSEGPYWYPRDAMESRFKKLSNIFLKVMIRSRILRRYFCGKDKKAYGTTKFRYGQ
jgi:hypothetical protein